VKIGEILKVTGGKLLSGDRNLEIDPAKISTDSRLIKRGEFFIALRGPNFCGSLFLEDAFKKGAIGAIVEDVLDTRYRDSKVLIKVKDAVKALQNIASAHRANFKIPVIAITGSNGKTTVKEMISAVLATKYSVLKNEGTKNNHIGVPETLLKLNRRHEICVLELGTNHRGEIRTLVEIAKPTMAVMTNVGASHLEHLSDLGGVFKEKRHILDSLDRRGVAVVNGDDPYLGKIKSARFKVLRYGFNASSDVRVSALKKTGSRLDFQVNCKDDYSLKLLGEHNIYNALAAISVARCFKVGWTECKKALLNFRPASMRLNPLTINGIPVINDSYNSNPASMKAALDTLKGCRANARWVVSGDMLELGRGAKRLHRLMGKLVAMSDVTGLLAFGKFSQEMLSGARAGGIAENRLWNCSSHSQMADIIRRVVGVGDIVLIKGSRGMRMERVVEILKG